MSVDPTAAVLACWAGANGVRYPTEIGNCVSLRSSPVLLLCVGSSYHCENNHCCPFWTEVSVSAVRCCVMWWWWCVCSCEFVLVCP